MEPKSITWPENQEIYIDEYQVPAVRKKPRSEAQIRTLEKAKAAAAKGREERRRALYDGLVGEKQEALKLDILSEVEKRIAAKFTPVSPPLKNDEPAIPKQETKPIVVSAPPTAKNGTPAPKATNKFAKYF